MNSARQDRHTNSKSAPVTPDQVRRAWILFQQRSAAGWSFTDCTSKVVIDELAVRTAAATDAHFHQFGNVVIVP